MFLFVSRTHDGQEHTVDADRGLDDEGSVRLVEFGIEVLYLLAAILSVLREVEVGTRVDTFHFLETEGHQELDVGSGIGIVRQFLVVMEAIFLIAQAEGFVPTEAELFPMFEPLHLGAGFYEELHLHLFKLAHTEDKLASHYLVTEGFTYLCDTERYLHATGLLNVEVVDEYTLCRLGTEVDLHGAVGGRAHLGLEHEVELTHVGPVACAADGAYYLFVQDDLFEFIEVVVVHGLLVALVQGIKVLLVLEYARVRLTEHSLIKTLAETFGGFLDFLVDLLLYLAELIFDEYVGAVTFLGVTVVDERIIESIYVTGGFPGRRMHEDSRVDTYYVVVEQGHRVPPIAFDIVFQFYAVLTIVIHGSEAVIYLAGREDESVFLAMSDEFFECFFLCCSHNAY